MRFSTLGGFVEGVQGWVKPGRRLVHSGELVGDANGLLVTVVT